MSDQPDPPPLDGRIHPDSGSRLPPPDRTRLDERARALYDRLADPAGGLLGGLRGPGGLRLASPELAEHHVALLDYLRHRAGIDAPLREVAILVTAREHDSPFEWAAHEPEALRVGVPADVVEAIKHHGDSSGLGERDAAVVELGRHLFRERRVPPEVFARAVSALGVKGLVDVVALMGMYAGTAALLATFDVQLDPRHTARLPTP